MCLAAICKNGPGLRKPWRSGRKACMWNLCIQLCMCGSVAAGRLYANYRAGGGEGVWQRFRLGIGLHALGYREPTTGLGWAPRGSSSSSRSLPKERDFELFFLSPTLAPSLSLLPSNQPLGNTHFFFFLFFYILALISHMWRRVPLIPGQTMKPIPKRGGGGKRGGRRKRPHIRAKVLRFLNVKECHSLGDNYALARNVRQTRAHIPRRVCQDKDGQGVAEVSGFEGFCVFFSLPVLRLTSGAPTALASPSERDTFTASSTCASRKTQRAE